MTIDDNDFTRKKRLKQPSKNERYEENSLVVAALFRKIHIADSTAIILTTRDSDSKCTNKQKGNDSDLMFSDGLDQGTIEIVDYNPKSKNSDIFGHSSGERVSMGRLTRHVHAM